MHNQVSNLHIDAKKERRNKKREQFLFCVWGNEHGLSSAYRLVSALQLVFGAPKRSFVFLLCLLCRGHHASDRLRVLFHLSECTGRNTRSIKELRKLVRVIRISTYGSIRMQEDVFEITRTQNVDRPYPSALSPEFVSHLLPRLQFVKYRIVRQDATTIRCSNDNYIHVPISLRALFNRAVTSAWARISAAT